MRDCATQRQICYGRLWRIATALLLITSGAPACQIIHVWSKYVTQRHSELCKFKFQLKHLMLWRSGQNMWFQCMISAQWLLLLQNHWPSVPAWNKESLGLTHFILESTSMFDAVRSYKRRGQYIQSREIIWHKRGILNRASVSQCLKIIFSSDKIKIRHTIY